EQEKEGTTFERDHHLRAAARADPRRAVALVEKLPEGDQKNYTRLAVIDLLLEDEEAARHSLSKGVGGGGPDRQHDCSPSRHYNPQGGGSRGAPNNLRLSRIRVSRIWSGPRGG